MIINHKNIKDNFILGQKTKIKFSKDYYFVPLKIKNDEKFNKCIFETPSLFIPYGIQRLENKKKILDLSFKNLENEDNNKFLNYLKIIYYSIKKKYHNYNVNKFYKKTQHDYCIRFKLSDDILLYDSLKNNIDDLKSYTYGKFIIYLNGLWIKDKEIWFQWILLQGKSENISPFKEYLFSDDENCKYKKMLKMGVPKEAVELKKKMDMGISIPPPPPLPSSNFSNKSTFDIPKIKASDLQNVKLKKAKINNKPKPKLVPPSNMFEPPSLEELQSTISKLKKSKLKKI